MVGNKRRTAVTIAIATMLSIFGAVTAQGQTAMRRHMLNFHTQNQQNHAIRDPAHVQAAKHTLANNVAADNVVANDARQNANHTYEIEPTPAAANATTVSHQLPVSPANCNDGTSNHVVNSPSYAAPTAHAHRHSIGHCRNYSHYGASAESLGSAVQANMDLQVFNGQRARMVLYEYDFHNGPNEDQSMLNAAGRQKLRRLLPLLETTGFPLMVEPSEGSPELSAARRINVVNYLESDLWYSNADSQVVLQESPALGLRGVEAVEIDRRQLETTRSQGTTFSGFASPRTASSAQSTQSGIRN